MQAAPKALTADTVRSYLNLPTSKIPLNFLNQWMRLPIDGRHRREKQIPITDRSDPLYLLVHDMDRAQPRTGSYYI